MAKAPEHHTDQHAQDAQYYRRVLHELTDIGADLARLVDRQAKPRRLHDDVLERLDEADLDEDDARPIGDIIEDICRDLDIAHFPDSHPWKHRTKITRLATRAATRLLPETRAPSASNVVVPIRPNTSTTTGPHPPD